MDQGTTRSEAGASIFILVGAIALSLSLCPEFAHAGALPIGGNAIKPPEQAPVVKEKTSDVGMFSQSPMHKMNTNCRKDTKFACGECETKLQDDFTSLLAEMTDGRRKVGQHWGESKSSQNKEIKSSMTMDEFLAKTAEVMKQNNPAGVVNYITIGESESLHGTSPGNPRIAMKSPNGELWVTFNTDPKAPGYDRVEIMRWNGKKAKYEFEEIVFKSAGGGHVDQNPSQCATCHHKPARPIWDSYRAWPGVIPPRDDLIETENPDKKPHGQVDASGRAYLDFLERVAKAKMDPSSKDPAAGRLRTLEIPISDQLDPSVKNKNPMEQVAAIREFTEKNGWYRVPHYPMKESLGNYDDKTAPKAGSAHLAFDQLMGQNMCRIANDLTKHPEFDRWKYGLAYLLNCGSHHPSKATSEQMNGILKRLFGNNLHQRAKNYLRQNRFGSAFQDLGKNEAYDDPYTAFLDDTVNSSKPDNKNKTELHSRYLSSYLREKEGKNAAQAATEVERTTEKKFNARVPYTVIGDPGGVRGVAEAAPATIAALRYILEPAGVIVGDWSMSRGTAVAGGRSFSYSDQFHVVLMDQPAIQDVMKEMKGRDLNETCQKLEEKSRKVSNVPQTTLKPREVWGSPDEGQK
ncbi:MAG: hypothetical protein KF789_11575 [Bdellovibrionaceae bacterium]|nr:hypothetical protein [Pseudobdellovibrionaceae bacterium]